MAMTEQIASTDAAGLFHRQLMHHIHGGHKHVLVSVIYNVAQTILLVGAFYLFSSLFHMNTGMIRGDLLIFLVTGVFIFNLHIKSAGSVLEVKPGGSFVAASLAGLYTQIYSLIIVLGGYALLGNQIRIHSLSGVGAGMLLSWLSGVGVGLVFRGVRPYSKRLAGFIAQAYGRINMLGSGQMFVANMLPAYVLSYFKWNPLFHIVDQTRGAAFLNYTPWYSDMTFPCIATIAVLVFGLLVDARTRRVELSRSSTQKERPE
jgi:hypothetical protein